jgi:hypothetical protein
VAAAVSRARWFFNEAVSGTTPTQSLDDTGNGNHLDNDYSSGDASYTSIAAGRGFNFSAAAVAANTARLRLSPLSARGNLATALFNNATEMSGIIVGNFATPGAGLMSTLMRLGSDLTSSGDFGLRMDDARKLSVRWGQEFGSFSTNFFDTPIGTGVRVIAFRIDTAQVAAADRVVIWIDGTQLASDVDDVYDIPLNMALASDTSEANFTIGNREAGDMNVLGPIYYAEVFSGSLTPTQATNSSTALLANNDANWVGDTTPPTFSVAPAVPTTTPTGGVATATISEPGDIFYVIVPNNDSPAPTSAQVVAGLRGGGAAALDSGSALATTTLNDAFSGLSASTAYDAYFVGRDTAGNLMATPTKVDFSTAAADTTPPAFTVGPGVTPNASGGTATGTIDETGSIFMVVVADGAAAPSSTQVIAGQNASGAAALATASATTTTTINAGFSGLSASTAYDAYFVARDDEGTPNVQASPTLVNFTTSAAATSVPVFVHHRKSQGLM